MKGKVVDYCTHDTLKRPDRLYLHALFRERISSPRDSDKFAVTSAGKLILGPRRMVPLPITWSSRSNVTSTSSNLPSLNMSLGNAASVNPT